MEQARFATTRWSVVLAAADPASPASADALATLCSTYWYPLYAFIRRHGYPADQAEDLTQSFFTRVLEKHYLANVGPEKGKFRSFLLVCLKRFLSSEWERNHAQKRGGGKAILSIDFADAENRYHNEPAHEMTAERIYERRWALTVLERALAALCDEMRQSGKSQLLDALKVYLAAEASAPPYAQVAQLLGMTEGAVKVAVHRLRQRYALLLRQEIAATLDDPAAIEEEIQHLFAAMAT